MQNSKQQAGDSHDFKRRIRMNALVFVGLGEKVTDSDLMKTIATDWNYANEWLVEEIE
jgi:hypothetical protein